MENTNNQTPARSSEEQLKALRDEAIRTGEMIELNQEKLPGCLYHRTAENDVARVEDRTFICSREKENAGPTNNWMDPKEMYAKLTKLYDGVMKGRTMYVIPYSMGPIGSPIATLQSTASSLPTLSTLFSTWI